MDTRIKIIIAVFLILVVFYFLQFMLEFVKKKEHFTSSYFDDAENYESKHIKEHFEDKQSETKPYELRIFILDEIEKLNITDKTVKGNVMEALFSETTMKELETMTKEERIAKVKAVYEKSKTDLPTTKKSEEAPTSGKGIVTQESKDSGKFIEEKIKSYFTNTVEEQDKERFNDSGLQSKVQKASEKLDVVIDNLKEMKGLLSGKEGYQPPEPPKVPKDPKDLFLIEGFENIKAYAYY